MAEHSLPVIMAISGPFLIAMGALLVYLGVTLVRDGRRQRRLATLVGDVTPIPPGEVPPDIDQIAVRGTARATDAGGTVDAPFSDDEAVVARTTVTTTVDQWTRTLHEGAEAVSFHLTDDTGTVRVEPHEDAIYEVYEAERVTTGSGDPPSDVQEWIDRTETVSPEGSWSLLEGDGRTYSQGLVQDGETAYVLGTPRPADDGQADVVIDAGDSPGEMVIADKSDADLESGGSGIGHYVIAGIIIAVALGAAIAGVGMSLWALNELVGVV